MSKTWRPTKETKIEINYTMKISRDVPPQVAKQIGLTVQAYFQVMSKKIMDEAKKKGVKYYDG